MIKIIDIDLKNHYLKGDLRADILMENKVAELH
jgi:hypothetical protein